MSGHIVQIAEKIFSAKNVLIMTHLRPDGDALGSSFGLKQALIEHNINASVILPSGMPLKYNNLCKADLETLEEQDLEKFDLFVSVDCANGERLGCSVKITPEILLSRNFINIDHHKGNSIGAKIQWVDETAPSASLMVTELLHFSGKKISPEAATFLMTGMMTDTGCFCFANTNSRAFHAAAIAADAGAKIEKIVNSIFFNKPLNQLKFEAELIEKHLQILCDGKVSLAYVPDELLKKYSFEMREDEGLIDIVRSVAGTVIALLIHRREDGFRVSLRSKDQTVPVRPIALEFNGGGHAMAAGCTINAPDFVAVMDKLLPLLKSAVE